MKKTVSIIAAVLSTAALLASCNGTENKPSATAAPATPDPELTKNTIEATITVEDMGDIQLELYPDLAPDTVENFVELAEDGFYDGTIFHRIIEDFMIQGGGYDETLKEKKTGSIKGEFAANGFENTLSHVRGVISMARTQVMDSASSQFFIVQEDATYLDGQYAAFGRVTDGMDIVDDIAASKTGTVAASGMEDVPVDPIVIESITIDSGSSKTNKKSDKKDDEEKTSDDSADKDTDNEDNETDEDNEAVSGQGEGLSSDDIKAILDAASSES